MANEIYEKLSEALLDESANWTISYSASDAVDPKLFVVNNPYSIDYERLVPENLSLPKFFDLASEIIENCQVREGIPEAERIKLVEDFNKEELHAIGNGKEWISFKLLSRKPAATSNDGKTIQQKGFTYYSSHTSPELPNRVLEMRSRPLDHSIQFSVWSTQQSLANRRALWLERLFVNNRWIFTVKGAEKFTFLERRADNLWQTNGSGLYERPLVFTVVLREFEIKGIPQLRHIELNITP